VVVRVGVVNEFCLSHEQQLSLRWLLSLFTSSSSFTYSTIDLGYRDEFDCKIPETYRKKHHGFQGSKFYGFKVKHPECVLVIDDISWFKLTSYFICRPTSMLLSSSNPWPFPLLLLHFTNHSCIRPTGLILHPPRLFFKFFCLLIACHGCIRWRWLSSKRKGQFWDWIWGVPFVTNGDFSTRIFPNYFGQ